MGTHSLDMQDMKTSAVSCASDSECDGMKGKLLFKYKGNLKFDVCDKVFC